MIARMRHRLAIWLRAIAALIEPDDGHAMWIAHDALYQRAATLTRLADDLAAGTSGAYKKWTYVMSRLQKEFPDRPVRELAQVIEAVL